MHYNHGCTGLNIYKVGEWGEKTLVTTVTTVPVNEKFPFRFRNTVVLFRDNATFRPRTIFVPFQITHWSSVLNNARLHNTFLNKATVATCEVNAATVRQ